MNHDTPGSEGLTNIVYPGIVDYVNGQDIVVSPDITQY